MYTIKSKNLGVLRFTVRDKGEYVQAVINNKEEVMTEELTSQIRGLLKKGLVAVSEVSMSQPKKPSKRSYTPKSKPVEESKIEESEVEEIGEVHEEEKVTFKFDEVE